MDEKNVVISIQARLQEMIGGEEFEQKLAQYAEKVRGVGKEISTGFNQLVSKPEFIENIPQNEQREIEKIQKSVESSARNATQQFEQTFLDFLDAAEEYPLNKQQVLKWNKNFIRAGRRATSEIDESINFIRHDIMPGLSDDTRKDLENLITYLEQNKERILDLHKGMRDYIQEYAKGLKDANSSFMEMLQKAGMLAIGGQVLQYGMNVARVGALIEAKEKTAFDLTSPQGMYREQAQLDLFKDTQTRSLQYSGIGSLIGALAGGILGGGNPLFIVGGAAFGGSLGSQLAELLNIEERAGVESGLKFKMQTYQLANQYYERARGYEIPATAASIRFHSDLRGTSDLGYTAEQELQFKQAFGETAGRFDQEEYLQQLAYARARGLDVRSIFATNIVGRLWGDAYGITQLSTAEELKNRTFGSNADNNRIIEILTAMKDIAIQQLQLDTDAKRDETARFLQIPSLLFGVDNPYGQLTNMGTRTLQSLQDIMRPKSQAQETFLYQALGGNGLIDFLERMKGGIFSGDNLQKILEFGSRYVNGDYMLGYLALNEMMPNAPKGLLPRLATLMAKGELEVPLDKDHPDQKTTITLDEFVRRFTAATKEGKKSEEDALSDILGIAKTAKTSFEDTAEEISNIQIKIGKDWAATIQDTQRKMAEWEDQWMRSGQTIERVAEMLEQGMSQLREQLKKLHIYTSEDDLKQDIQNKIYNSMYEKAYNYLNMWRQEYLGRISDEELRELLLSKGKNITEYKRYLAELMSDPFNVLFKEPLKTEEEDVKKWEKWLDDNAIDYYKNDLYKEKLQEYRQYEERYKQHEGQKNIQHDPSFDGAIQDADKRFREFRDEFEKEQIEPIINEASKKYRVDPKLIRSIIKVESGNDQDAISQKGAKGLMQLMDSTAAELGVTDIFDPRENIFGGTKYLSQLLKRYGGNLELALAAYNAGPAKVDLYQGIPPYKETIDYVRTVKEQYEAPSGDKSNLTKVNLDEQSYILKQLNPFKGNNSEMKDDRHSALLEGLIDKVGRIADANAENRNIHITVSFENVPPPLMDHIQNAMIGVTG